MVNEQKIIAILSQDRRIEAAYLLGSAATDTMRPDSDIDIGILPAANELLCDLDRANIGMTLCKEFGKVFDIGLVSSKNLVYAKEAILCGRRLFERDLKNVGANETRLLSMFAHFNEDRQEVLNAYRA